MTATNGGYGRGRPRFTDEQRRAILTAYDQGASGYALSRTYGCSPAAIYYHLEMTLRHRRRADRVPVPGGPAACVRCGIDMGRAGMCLDCLDVEALA